MKKGKKLFNLFSVRHRCGRKVDLAREDVLELALKINLSWRGCVSLASILSKWEYFIVTLESLCRQWC